MFFFEPITKDEVKALTIEELKEACKSKIESKLQSF
jgi:hypothetical protein